VRPIVVLLLALGVLLAASPAARATPALGSTGAAVDAQLPDAEAQPSEDGAEVAPPGPAEPVTLGAMPGRSVEPRGTAERVVQAVVRGAAPGVRELAALPVLLAVMAALAAAALLPPRRPAVRRLAR